MIAKVSAGNSMIRSVGSRPSVSIMIISSRTWRDSTRIQSAVGLPGHASSDGPSDGNGRSLSSSFKGEEGGVAVEDGHAVLHDFCMTIPFSVAGLVASIALFILGGSLLRISEALPVFSLGSIAVGLASAFSLSLWKKGQVGTVLTSLSTAVSGGASAFIAYKSWICLQFKSSTLVLSVLWPLLVLSGCVSLFAFYNIVAGGNPPKKK